MRGYCGSLTGWLRCHLGYRGTFLLFLAVLDLAYGWSLWVAPPRQQASADLVLGWHAWGAIWAAAGIVCAAGAPLRRDRFAYTTAAALKAAWASVAVRLWLFGHDPRAWVGALIWIAFGATVLVISSWPEPVLVPADLPPLPEAEAPEAEVPGGS